MIGDGWDDEPSIRPDATPDAPTPGRRRVAIITGTRAEFGLLRPIMHAVHAQPALELAVIAAGSHLISPAITFREVKREFAIAGIVPMQVAGRVGRAEDVESLARGIARFGRVFTTLRPDWVLVLGDRIEAFAAASAASVGGFAVAHVHGGDRAEGIADEAMRHAITKLAHLHLAATEASAQRIRAMGERADLVRVVGSPAIDGLDAITPMDDDAHAELGSPDALVLMHPVGRPDEIEEAAMSQVVAAITSAGRRALALEPNFDPGREGIRRALGAGLIAAGANPAYGPDARHAPAGVIVVRDHLPRNAFLALLKRLARDGGVLIGNSSAGLIEAAALGVCVLNIGHRQAGRERAGRLIDVEHEEHGALEAALRKTLALAQDRAGTPAHPYGDGHTGPRCAQALIDINPHDPRVLRKRCTY